MPDSPMDAGFEVVESDFDVPPTEEMISLYRSLIGSIGYAATTVRFDVSYGLNVLSRFMEKPNVLKARKRGLNPRPCADNAHASVLPFEMEAIEPGDGEIPTRKLIWKPLGFLSHIKRRCTIDDRFPITLWEVWSCSSLGVPIPALIGRIQVGCPS